MTVLITGCSSGIGLELVKIFLNYNWNVVATLRNPLDLKLETSDKLLILPLDVTNSDSIISALDKSIAKFGTIDLLINNAGYGLFGIFEEMNENDWQKQMDVNFLGSLRMIKQILPIMRKQKRGTMIFISSIVGDFALPVSSLYCASKFALNGFIESLQYELNYLNIKVKLILPGSVKSKFWKNSKFIASTKAEYKEILNKKTQSKKRFFSTKASTVGKRIYKIAISKKRKLTYYVTLDAKIALVASKILSASLRQKIIKLFF